MSNPRDSVARPMAHIRSINSEFQAGGGCRLDEITLHDGSILVIGEENILLYRSEIAYSNNDHVSEMPRIREATISEFRKSRHLCHDLAAHSDDVAHENVPGFAYAWNLVIELTACGQFMLTLGRDSYTGSLEDLEVRLFEWAMNEGIAIKLEIP